MAKDEIGICTATLLDDPLAAGEAEVGAAAEAALAAGFTSASVWAQHLPVVIRSGLRVEVVEAAIAWPGADTSRASAEARHLADVAAGCGARLVAAACLEPAISDRGRAADNLAALAGTVAEAGARLCLEFLPGTAVADLETAWSFMRSLGPSATIVLDTWHWVRQPGGPAWDVLATVPGERIAYVQLCDAAPDPQPGVMAETMTARRLPGEGAVDFPRVLAALDAIGARPYIATEIFNPRLLGERGIEGAAAAMHASALRVSGAA